MLVILKAMTESINWNGKNILVAEDEEINFLFIETLLNSTGAKVFHAWNGKQVLEFLESGKPVDLVLMDIKMPIMDGLKATQELKRTNPGLPVIAQTAYTLGDDKSKCFAAGCDDYISKPIRKNILLNAIALQFQNV